MDKEKKEPVARLSTSGYSPGAMEHFLNPRNVGRVDDPDGIGRFGDPECGDYLEVTISLQGDLISDIRFRVQGCPGAISTSSAMTCLVKWKNFRVALGLTDDDVVEYLGGIPERKRHCSLLGVKALRAAISDAVLMRSLIAAGVVRDKEDYRKLDTREVFEQMPGHDCDGSCGGAREYADGDGDGDGAQRVN